MKTLISYRACSAVYTTHGSERPFGLSKDLQIQTCFKSLQREIKNEDVDIIVICDRVSDFTKEIFKSCDKVKDIIDSEPGMFSSLFAGLSDACSRCQSYDWIYFIEDDYLHSGKWYESLKCLNNSKLMRDNKNLCLLPDVGRGSIMQQLFDNYYCVNGGWSSFAMSNDAFERNKPFLQNRYFHDYILERNDPFICQKINQDSIFKDNIYQQNNNDDSSKTLALAYFPCLVWHMHTDKPCDFDGEKLVNSLLEELEK